MTPSTVYRQSAVWQGPFLDAGDARQGDSFSPHRALLQVLAILAEPWTVRDIVRSAEKDRVGSGSYRARLSTPARRPLQTGQSFHGHAHQPAADRLFSQWPFSAAENPAWAGPQRANQHIMLCAQSLPTVVHRRGIRPEATLLLPRGPVGDAELLVFSFDSLRQRTRRSGSIAPRRTAA